MAGSMVYRLRVDGPDSPHIARFREAMRTIQGLADDRGYQHVAGFHGAPGSYCWHHQFNPRTPIQARLFLPWHRAYLWWLEQALQDVDPEVGLPWWDWSVQRGVPDAYGLEEVDGEPNPLFSFRIHLPQLDPPIEHATRRDPDDPDRLPRAELIERLVAVPDWETFSDVLQNVHDSLHGWVGGDMASVTTASYDPIFFAHHAMVDRLWSLWQVRHGANRIPESLLDLELQPFGKRVRDVLDVQRLGYEYALQATNFDLGD